MSGHWFRELDESHATKGPDDHRDLVELLRVQLLNLQFDLRHSDTAALVLLAGDDRPGCADALRALHDWLDARYLDTHVLQGHYPEADRLRPPGWRYWTRLPPRGHIGVLLGAWATEPVAARIDGTLSEPRFARALDEIRHTEELLARDGMLLLKFWLHLPAAEHAKRLRRAKRKPHRHWQLEERDWEAFEHYDEALALVERMLEATQREEAPWTIVDSRDPERRNSSVAQQIAERLQARLAHPPPSPVAIAAPPAEEPNVLDGVDLSARLPKRRYESELRRLQRSLNGLSRRARAAGRACVLVFEGWDAAGKGGAIRRLTRAMPVANYRVFPIGAPDAGELAFPYLWRFWNRVPEAGRTAIFDRSWYGRVLVERVEGLARPDEWGRAYDEINDFERALLDFGIPVLKFFLHIDPDEQLRRFQAREETPYKKYKLTEEDQRNRGQWDLYRAAIHDMVGRTSTAAAPWHLVAANDKRHARIEVLRTVCEGLEAALEPAG